jgi:hypothetical protein
MDRNRIDHRWRGDGMANGGTVAKFRSGAQRRASTGALLRER